MNFIRKRRKHLGDIAVLAVIVLAFAFDLLRLAEYRTQDIIYRDFGLLNPDINIIGIDEAAIAKLGNPGQWTRRHMADAINILNSGEGKPAVIAVDVLYTGEGDDAEANKILAEAAESGGNVVLVSYADMGLDMSLSNAVKDYILPYGELARHTAHGFANARADDDKVVRRATLKIWRGGEAFYSFPYEIYKKYTESALEYAENNDEAYIAYTSKPGSYYSGVSFADIFEDGFDPEFYEGGIVMIGAYAAGLMDSYFTPADAELMHGVEIHANVLQMLLDENFKEYAPRWINFAAALLFALIIIILAELLDIRLVLAVFAVMAAGYALAAKFIIYEAGWIPAVFYPVSAGALAYIYKLAYGYIIHALEKASIKSAFKKYVDPKLVDRLMESGEAHSDEVGVKKNIAVVFVDVRGFTPMTEALSDTPERVVEILNEYLELTASAVFNNGGSVDKFIGDATMALFNGFVPLDDYIYKAVKAAWDMVKGAAGVNASLKEKYGVDVGFGIGVNCGKAIVGNLGPPFRKDYTAIGDVVNTASRLESNAKRSEVLITKAVYEALRDRVRADSIGEIALKGKSARVEVYTVTQVL